jgi:hypothetical protein
MLSSSPFHSLCTSGLRYSFGTSDISSNRASRAEKGTEVSIDEAEDLQLPSTHATFPCPITIEDETDPCIIIVFPDAPLLKGKTKDVCIELINICLYVYLFF